MTRASKVCLGLVVVAGAGAGAAVARKVFLDRGISARDQPTAAEAFVARRLRHWVVPRGERDAKNPVTPRPKPWPGRGRTSPTTAPPATATTAGARRRSVRTSIRRRPT